MWDDMDNIGILILELLLNTELYWCDKQDALSKSDDDIELSISL